MKGNQMIYKGVITALITPMKHNGEIDKIGFIDLIEWQIEQGVDGLVPCGTTGESATITDQERIELIRLCVETVKGRVPIIVGAGSNSTQKAIEYTQTAKQAGADAAMSVAPYYNKPDQKGAIAHYKAIADQTGFPVLIYNVPSRTLLDLSVETVCELSHHPNIIGIKDASADMTRPLEYQENCQEGFTLLSGDDGSCYSFQMLGGVGCISVASNIIPGIYADFFNALKSSDFKRAFERFQIIYAVHKTLYLSPSPAPVKYALSRILGSCSNVRLPLLEASIEAKQAIDRVLKHYTLI